MKWIAHGASVEELMENYPHTLSTTNVFSGMEQQIICGVIGHQYLCRHHPHPNRTLKTIRAIILYLISS